MGVLRTLGARLKDRRRVLGLDLIALETAIGARPGVLVALERGLGDVSLPELLGLAAALDVSVDYFFESVPRAGKAGKKNLANAEVRSFLAAYWAVRDVRARRGVLALVRAAAEYGF